MTHMIPISGTGAKTTMTFLPAAIGHAPFSSALSFWHS